MIKARHPALRFYFIAFLLWAFALWISIRFGTVEHADIDLIVQLRLPRALMASAIGLGLAVAGTLLQALFANPLCEPYTLGISSGSALGAVIGAALGIERTILGFAGLGPPAFLGALVFGSILYFLAHRSREGSATLLLSGVMLGYLGSSLVTLWMALADPSGIQGVLFWLLGDLSRARLRSACIALIGTSYFGFVAWRQSRDLDALLMGEQDALALGVSVDQLRRKIVWLTSLLVALCVSGGGMIGFIGLVVPHLARRMVGSLHAKLIPMAALLGATALTTADLVARVAARPQELPAGVVTALVGAPIFIFMLFKRPKW